MKYDGAYKYQWFSSGDIGAAATIIFDNLAVLAFMALILQFGYRFPVDIIMSNIIPGTVVGVLVGNLLCFWLGFRLAKKERRNVTAMLFGLDAPSSIGFAVCILGPVYNFMLQKGFDAHISGIHAWQVGVGCLFITGIIKLCVSFFANKIKSKIPQCALLGALGGVAIALIGFFPLISIFQVPTIGLFSLGLVFLVMFAKLQLPFKIPGIPVAIILGTAFYYALMPFGLSGSMPHLSAEVTFLLPMPTLGFFRYLKEIVNFLPIIFPFAMLVIFGTMSVVESADCMGEKYVVRDLMLTDSVATICSSLFGGVAQTTPYAGFPAFKKMDARAGFILLNVIVVGIGGLFGLVGVIVNFVPQAAIAPVLLYVAFEITEQCFVQCEKELLPVVFISFLPSIARLLQIKLTDGSLISVDKLQLSNFSNIAPTINDHLAIIILGNGFIVTGTLWAAMLYFAIKHKWISCLVSSIILAILSYFGIIHSLYISGEIYFPSSLPQSIRHIPLELAIGYLSFGILAYLLSRLPENKK